MIIGWQKTLRTQEFSFNLIIHSRGYASNVLLKATWKQPSKQVIVFQTSELHACMASGGDSNSLNPVQPYLSCYYNFSMIHKPSL